MTFIISDIKHDWENRVPQIKVDVDQQRAKRAGVTSADIAQSLERYFSGQSISEFREGDDIFPIMVRAEDSERFDLDRIYSVNVFASDDTGQALLISKIAAFLDLAKQVEAGALSGTDEFGNALVAP